MIRNHRLNNVLVLLLAVGLTVAITGCAGKGKKGPETPATPTTETTKTTAPTTDTRPKVSDDHWFQDPDAIKTIYFDYDKSNIRADQQAAMANNIKVLSDQYKDAKVKLVGHCDERGSNEYNMALGERRADSVFKALVAGGIDAGRLTPISMGEEEPVDPGHNETAWSKNRRVEFWLAK